MRKYNFNSGPATLPLPVLEQVKKELLDYRGQGFSILESSHRNKTFEAIINGAKDKILKFLELNDHVVLFMHGGASSEFFRIPMNLLSPNKIADYIETGTWVKKAFKEAKTFANPIIIASSEDKNYSYIPKFNDKTESKFNQQAEYVYLCSNNTIFGTQYKNYPDTGDIPLIGDFTSDIFCRKIDLNKFGIIFAGAQKNLGPAGLSIVIIRNDILKLCKEDIPSMCSYKVMEASNSLFNTSPVFQIYFVNLVLEWMEKEGGIAVFEKKNRLKAKLLYEVIDRFEIYQGKAKVDDRSIINITWSLPNHLIKKFLQGAEQNNLTGLRGHFSVGGIRASSYNSLSYEATEVLSEYMINFAKSH